MTIDSLKRGYEIHELLGLLDIRLNELYEFQRNAHGYGDYDIISRNSFSVNIDTEIAKKAIDAQITSVQSQIDNLKAEFNAL